MPNFFFTEASGNKSAPLNKQQLQALIDRRVIAADTLLETDSGYTGLAGQIPGLKFDTAVSQSGFAVMTDKIKNLPKPILVAGITVIASCLFLILAVSISHSGGGGGRPSSGGASRGGTQLDQLRAEREEVRRKRNEAEDWLRRVGKHNELVAKIERRGGMAELEFSLDKDKELWDTPVGTIKSRTEQAERDKIQADRRLEEIESKIRDLENGR